MNKKRKKQEDKDLENTSHYEDVDAITRWDDTYIKIERQFTDPSSDFFLSVEELFIFAVISIDQRKDNSLYTCFYMIEENMSVRFRVNNESNRSLIKETLKSLRDKKIISLHGTFDYKKPYDLFYIRINYDLFEGQGEPWRGFNEIPLKVINQVKRMEHLYIYNTVKGYDKSKLGGFVCSYSGWKDILNRSTSSVKRYIKEMTIVKGRDMCDKSVDLIYANYGDYIEGSRVRQHANAYKTIEFEEKEKTTQTKNKDSQSERSNKGKDVAFGKEKDNPF